MLATMFSSKLTEKKAVSDLSRPCCQRRERKKEKKKLATVVLWKTSFLLFFRRDIVTREWSELSQTDIAMAKISSWLLSDSKQCQRSVLFVAKRYLRTRDVRDTPKSLAQLDMYVLIDSLSVFCFSLVAD